MWRRLGPESVFDPVNALVPVVFDRVRKGAEGVLLVLRLLIQALTGPYFWLPTILVSWRQLS